MRNYTTQMDAARKNIITPEAIVAAIISTAVCTALFAALRNRR